MSRKADEFGLWHVSGGILHGAVVDRHGSGARPVCFAIRPHQPVKNLKRLAGGTSNFRPVGTATLRSVSADRDTRTSRSPIQPTQRRYGALLSNLTVLAPGQAVPIAGRIDASRLRN